jgi:hypothetical protein
MKKSGKTLIIFLILIVVILVSGIAISLFLLSKETQTRKAAETTVEQLKTRNQKVDEALKEAEKQIEILKGKNKDADEKINSLMEELELESGLRDQIKEENKKLKDTLEAEAKSKVELRQKMTAELDAAQNKLTESEAKVAEAVGLQTKIDELTKQNEALQKQITDLGQATSVPQAVGEIVPPPDTTEKIDLDRIVVTPEDAKQGKVLNVDTETEFLIFDLGSRHGIRVGDIMSVYRGKAYLGDVKVTRAQEEMSAADFIPPFSSRKVRKNDQVVQKL